MLVPALLAGWFAWAGRRREIRATILVGLIALAVAAPWHVSMVMIHGQEFTRQFVGAEIGDRVMAQMAAGEGGNEPWWFYLAQIGTSYWPWLAVVAMAAVAMARGRHSSPAGRAERLAILWTVGWLIVLSAFPDRRDRYALPMYPSLALLVGPWIAAALAEKGPGLLRRIGVIGAAAGLVLAFLPIRLQRPVDPQWPALFDWLDARRAAGEAAELWQGALGVERGARLYIRYGQWPRTTRNRLGEFVIDRESQPPPGAWIIYHARDGLAPGANESTLFESGHVKVTRLGDGGWSPIEAPDPGG